MIGVVEVLLLPVLVQPCHVTFNEGLAILADSRYECIRYVDPGTILTPDKQKPNN